MKCPHCGYMDGWDADSMKAVDGEKGGFYSLNFNMERYVMLDTDEKRVYGCPSCNKLFMEE